LINPYVYASKNREEVIDVKNKLELQYLRHEPIHAHFDHHEKECDEEMISFDKFLSDNYNFSFLTDGFNHAHKVLNGQILYGKNFPETLLDKELLAIQEKMDKYHFELIEQPANQKSIIIMNPWNFVNPLRDSEFYKLTAFYDSKSDAQKLMDTIIEGQFDLYGTHMTVGNITEHDLTRETMMILRSNTDFKYKSRYEDPGQTFVSDKGLGVIKNGMEILMKLFASVNKSPYEIVELG
jgi:hypothetical protein